jgi:hypothetical protein
MEDGKQLIDELLVKLAELNSKVDSFRQDMLSEFNKFTEDLLKGVPDNVSHEVTRVITESIAKYPALSMSSGYEHGSESESPVSPTISEPRLQREGRKSPPPVLKHTSGIPKIARDAPRGPHDREIEFQGVFTPTYLPLLDGNDPPVQQRRIDPSLAFKRPAGHPLFPGGGPSPGGEPPAYSSPVVVQPASNKDDDDEVAVVEMIEEVETPVTGKGKEVARPTPARELTDVSVASSAGSSVSEHKTRRSALRRSSSSNKGSPRRVRFDVEGAEVLPTVSPQPTASVLGHMVDHDAEAEASSAIDDSEDYSGPSLSDVEGEEDHRPRPPRISSTEALRRLSRTPSDDGTIWIPSNETSLPNINGHGPRESGSAAANTLAEKATSRLPTATRPMVASSGNPVTTQYASPPHGMNTSQAPHSTARAQENQGEDDDSSEEEFLAIKPSRKTPSPAATSPAATSPAARSPLARDISSQLRDESPKPAPTATDTGKGKEVARSQHADEDELFDFDDPVTGSASTEKYLPEEEDEETIADDHQKKGSGALPSMYSTSPAVSIPRHETPSPPSSHSKPMPESIGSYRGQPLRMGVVRSPKIAAQVAAMGDIKTYVGSVHGRTGVDPADESSYRASFSNAKLLSGTPRSFSERLMIEEAMGKRNDDKAD